MSDVVEEMRNTTVTGNGMWRHTMLAGASEIERLREERRWISVGERLPDDNVQVLVWGEGWRSPAIGWREHRPWYTVPETIWTLGDEIDRGFPPQDITHWMPLPTGPTSKDGP